MIHGNDRRKPDDRATRRRTAFALHNRTMKKHFAIVLIILTLAMPSFAQELKNSTASTSQDNTAVVDRSGVLRRVMNEVESSRELVAELREREARLVKEIAEAEATDKKLTEAYKEALIELGELRGEIKARVAAEAGLLEQIRVLREDGARKDGEIKAVRKQNLMLTIGSIIMTVVSIVR